MFLCENNLFTKNYINGDKGDYQTEVEKTYPYQKRRTDSARKGPFHDHSNTYLSKKT